jgi:two-component system, LytTR family, response regulator
MSLRIIIVDDEPNARASLKVALQAVSVPHVVVAEAEKCRTAIELIDLHRPDVALLDIRLGDGSGFDVIERIGHRSTRVIFTTAYDHYAIRAFRYAAVDYLLKPVAPKLLQEALLRVPSTKKEYDDRLQTLLNNLRHADSERIVLPTSEGLYIVPPQEIIRCEADSNYTRIHTSTGQRLLTARTLKDVEEMLKDHRFERVHMSHVVSLAHVRRYVNRDGGILQMSDGAEVPVSQRRRHLVLIALGHKA